MRDQAELRKTICNKNRLETLCFCQNRAYCASTNASPFFLKLWQLSVLRNPNRSQWRKSYQVRSLGLCSSSCFIAPFRITVLKNGSCLWLCQLLKAFPLSYKEMTKAEIVWKSHYFSGLHTFSPAWGLKVDACLMTSAAGFMINGSEAIKGQLTGMKSGGCVNQVTRMWSLKRQPHSV